MTHDITVPGVEQICVVGRLAANATQAASAGNDPTFFVMVDIEPRKGMPYHATLILGTGQAADYASTALADKLKKGDLVEISARGLRVKADHGRAQLVLMDVLELRPFDPKVRGLSATWVASDELQAGTSHSNPAAAAATTQEA